MRQDVRADVRAELAFDPRVDSGDVAVAANGGEVSLRGTVGSAWHMRQAQCAARRVRGVTSVRNDLRVRPLASGPSEDVNIRTAVLQALMLNVAVPDTIHADVARGVVHLAGKATWQCERDEAELVCTAVPGVRGIEDDINLIPVLAAGDVQQSVIAAYRRNASLARNLLSADVLASGVVILSGTVTSWAEHEEAVAAAWSAPGVTRVEDRILLVC
jgi:osmotically-inducible protein OsmY